MTCAKILRGSMIFSRQIMDPAFRALIAAKDSSILAHRSDAGGFVEIGVRKMGALAAVRVRYEGRLVFWRIDHDFARILRKSRAGARQINGADFRNLTVAKDASIWAHFIQSGGCAEMGSEIWDA